MNVAMPAETQVLFMRMSELSNQYFCFFNIYKLALDPNAASFRSFNDDIGKCY
jgi:hypothetical protein